MKQNVRVLTSLNYAWGVLERRDVVGEITKELLGDFALLHHVRCQLGCVTLHILCGVSEYY